MNRKSVSKRNVVSALGAGLMLILGLYLIIHAFAAFEVASGKPLSNEDYHNFVLPLMAGVSLVTVGLFGFFILFLHMLRRTVRIQKEAAALEKKNEQIRVLNAQIRQLNHHQRLEIIGTLTSSIAHEFNNLLTPIMGYSLMALEKLPPEEEELYDNLLEVYNASREAKTLISRLNDLSRKQSETSFRMISLDDIVSHAMKVARPAKPEKVQIRQSLNCRGQLIRGNEIQLSQMLLNLVLNSFHAMEDGGELVLETSFDEEWAYVRVADTGCGIPVEHMPRIFEPFFTTKETGKGTGLGLAIAAQTVEDHQGKIHVDSQEGEYTVFTVQLPRDGKNTEP